MNWGSFVFLLSWTRLRLVCFNSNERTTDVTDLIDRLTLNRGHVSLCNKWTQERIWQGMCDCKICGSISIQAYKCSLLSTYTNNVKSLPAILLFFYWIKCVSVDGFWLFLFEIFLILITMLKLMSKPSCLFGLRCVTGTALASIFQPCLNNKSFECLILYLTLKRHNIECDRCFCGHYRSVLIGAIIFSQYMIANINNTPSLIYIAHFHDMLWHYEHMYNEQIRNIQWQ